MSSGQKSASGSANLFWSVAIAPTFLSKQSTIHLLGQLQRIVLCSLIEKGIIVRMHGPHHAVPETQEQTEVGIAILVVQIVKCRAAPKAGQRRCGVVSREELIARVPNHIERKGNDEKDSQGQRMNRNQHQNHWPEGHL